MERAGAAGGGAGACRPPRPAPPARAHCSPAAARHPDPRTKVAVRRGANSPARGLGLPAPGPLGPDAPPSLRPRARPDARKTGRAAQGRGCRYFPVGEKKCPFYHLFSALALGAPSLPLLPPPCSSGSLLLLYLNRLPSPPAALHTSAAPWETALVPSPDSPTA